MENNELTGNTILFKNTELFENVTDISCKEYRRNSISNKRNTFNLLIGVLVSLLVISMFIVAFFIDNPTIRAVLIIISAVSFGIDISISMYLIFKKTHITNTANVPSKLVIKFYELSLQSSVYKNDIQVSTYYVSYSDVTKVLIKDKYLTIFNKTVQPLTISKDGFNVPDALEQLLNKLEELKIPAIHE